jgi:hypothetical protein
VFQETQRKTVSDACTMQNVSVLTLWSSRERHSLVCKIGTSVLLEEPAYTIFRIFDAEGGGHIYISGTLKCLH